MKTLQMTKKILSKIKDKYYTCMAMLMLLMTGSAFAANGDDPFPSIQVQDGDVVKAVGTHMETSMKYSMIGGGIIMMLVGIGVIMHRLREDSANKDTGSFLTTLIISGLAITVGIILIAIGWGAASYQPQS
ncbi:MAG: hypothetical protein COV52_01890 [Gammaproteobacteria bacterium CG11_big_fil_rev_8_21_14_0_20_46_22]|nr:MAG: hypothetical protein COW05_05785 [Gammaproteobacteria bacterium CG12_big_fil_rev_8_21_14_0_65_46_12]PIR11866.1 MAG: hypothetical protein COV52_01890 [Gammaproteobacteria bacterium CG11_big_fil_rev_8_21_14_0_20_46_22]